MGFPRLRMGSTSNAEQWVIVVLLTCAVGVAASASEAPPATGGTLTLFLAGDTMTGRGVDQVLPNPMPAEQLPPWLDGPEKTVQRVEAVNGPVERPISFADIWGEVLEELERVSPDVRIINLETSVTTSIHKWPNKKLNFRMNPANVPCLTALGVDCCVLANNHVGDWGHAGVRETLETLHGVGIQTAGAGVNLQHAEAPAIIEVGEKGRVLVFGIGSLSAGIPPRWAATQYAPGLNLVAELSQKNVQRFAAKVAQVKRPGDVVVASIHWGVNWGYEVPEEQQRFAHALIDEAGVDLVHGHSSHHVKGFEIYHGKLVLYGCGDLIQDWEALRGRREMRTDLVLLYFPTVNLEDGRLVSLEMVPMRIRRLSLGRAAPEEAQWLAETMDREARVFGTSVELVDGRYLHALIPDQPSQAETGSSTNPSR